MKIGVMLLTNVPRLGHAGDVLMVSRGYFMNFLLPQGMAKRANDTDIAQMEEKKKVAVEKQSKMLADAAEIMKAVADLKTLTIKAKAAEGGSLFGSVDAAHIAEALSKAVKKEIDTSAVLLKKSIKEVGTFPVTLAMGESKAEIELVVEAE